MFILLLLALAVSGVGAWARRRWPAFGQVLMVVGVLSLTAISIVQIRQIVFPPAEKTIDHSQMAVSYYLANCVLADLADQNGTVILLFPPRSLMDESVEESFETGFMMPLRHGHGTLHLKAIHFEAKPGNAGYDLAAFQQVLAQDPEALAVVSYVGVPVDFNNASSTGQPKIPPFYAFDSEGTTNWVGLMKDGHVKAVVLPRPGIDSHTREAATGRPEQIFERFYLLATQETADQVAAQISVR
jgi:hypothetical protein